MVAIVSIIPQMFGNISFLTLFVAPVGITLIIFSRFYTIKIIKRQRNSLEIQAKKVIKLLDAGSTASIEVVSHATELTVCTSEVNIAAEEITNTIIQSSDLTNKQVESIKIIDQIIEEVRNISKILKNISNQTNLLTLNASVKAGRAGEHGRGFAEVIERVQILSEESKNSVEKSKLIIESIYRNISEDVELSKKIYIIFGEINGATEEQTSSIEEITATASKFGALSGDLRNILNKYESNKTYENNKEKQIVKKKAIFQLINSRIKK